MSSVCPDCAAPIEAGERFCGDCGAYLDWSDGPPGRDEASGAAPEGAATPAPAVTPAPAAEPVREPAGAPPPAPPRSAPPPPPPRSAPSAPPPPPTGAPGPPGPVAAWQPPPAAAQAMVVPVEHRARQPGPQQPAPQHPGAPAPKPRRRRSPDDVPIQHGDLICGGCGAGNKPTRKFCRRCGRDLVEAEVAKIPWWRRILQRKPRTREAGSRPKDGSRRRVRVPGRLVAVVATVAVLAGGGYLLRGYVVGAYDAVADRVIGVEKRNPDRITASSSHPDHPARLARNGVTNEYWAPAEPGDGRGESLTAGFAEPVRLVYLLITPGVSEKDEELFLQHGRPAVLRAVLRQSDGGTQVENIELDDEMGSVQVGIGVSDITEVTLEIRRSYRGSSPGSRTAIGEVQFFVRE